jgi:hypothetical protein
LLGAVAGSGRSCSGCVQRPPGTPLRECPPPSALPLFRCVEHPMPCALGHARGVPLINDRSESRSRRWGALRSEIKEEAAGRGTFAEQGAPSAGAPPRMPPVQNHFSIVLFHRAFHAGRFALMLSQSMVTAVFIHWLMSATCFTPSPTAGALGLVGICAPYCNTLA